MTNHYKLHNILSATSAKHKNHVTGCVGIESSQYEPYPQWHQKNWHFSRGPWKKIVWAAIEEKIKKEDIEF